MVNFWIKKTEGVKKEELLKLLDQDLEKLAQGKYLATKDFVVYIVDRDRVTEAVKKLLEYEYTRLSVIAGNDERFFRNDFSLTYVIAFDRQGLYVGIRTYLPLHDLKVESLAKEVRAAWWHERENRDLYGFEFEGLEDPRRLVIPEYWPRDVYPWRKDHPYNKPVAEWSEEHIDYKPIKEEKIEADVVAFGPYHLVTDEPIHWRLYVRGEIIVDVEHRGFHNWRGIEKIAEGRLTYNQIPFIAERICGICGYAHACAYCQAIESIANIDIPDRARYIRSIMLEIERIESHLLWIGIACHILGFDTGFMHAWKIREHIMHLAEVLTGNRKTYGMNLIGGVRRDLLGDRLKKAIEYIKFMRSEYKELYDMIINNTILVKRTKDVGFLPRDKAISYGVVGPVARAVGIRIDVRKDHPYAAYKELSFEIPIYSESDVLARTLVRLDEVFESFDIIEQALDSIPGGPLLADVNEIPSNKDGVGYTEAPRGEDIHYVRTGLYNKIQRWRVRAPSYANVPSVKEMLIGYRIADAPIIYASVDPCLACTERCIVIDIGDKSKRIISWNQLVELSRKISKRMGL